MAAAERRSRRLPRATRPASSTDQPSEKCHCHARLQEHCRGRRARRRKKLCPQTARSPSAGLAKNSTRRRHVVPPRCGRLQGGEAHEARTAQRVTGSAPGSAAKMAAAPASEAVRAAVGAAAKPVADAGKPVRLQQQRWAAAANRPHQHGGPALDDDGGQVIGGEASAAKKWSATPAAGTAAALAAQTGPASQQQRRRRRWRPSQPRPYWLQHARRRRASWCAARTGRAQTRGSRQQGSSGALRGALTGTGVSSRRLIVRRG